MLQTISIENVALIDRATLHFDEKLNVISGETGSGKSIMLDSLSFVFGGRADRTLIRQGETSMKVEAIFTGINEGLKSFLNDEYNISCDEEMFLSRTLDINGKNICKVNGELVPVAVVKKICQQLIDLHGQSEHQAILNNDYQLEIIDLYSKGAENIKLTLNKLIDDLDNINQQIKNLGGSESEKQNLIDLYTYQINEIELANIKAGEYEELINEKKEMMQYEKINEALKGTYDNLATNNYSDSANEKVLQAIKTIQTLTQINEHYLELYERLNSALIEINDISDTIYDDIENNIFDEERYNYIDERIDLIKTLFRKYGADYEGMKKYHENIATKLDNLINSAEKYKLLTREKEELLNKIKDVQDDLTDIRKKTAIELSRKMEIELKTLGMPNARMHINFDKTLHEYSRLGWDRVEFMLSANLGIDTKPLNKVASGGEMSRVMLAYKIVVSEVDNIHTIIFDEIDTGLSGNIATVVAEYMARLSMAKQIIAISHLPQICAMADVNVKVEKYTDGNLTKTKSRILEDKDLYIEIARLMGISNLEQGLQVAIELKNKSESFKNQ